MFDFEQFISDCQDALRQDQSQSVVRDVVTKTVSDPATVLKALGEPQRGQIQTLYRADDLTILNVIWAPWMTVLPHNHQMWAVIARRQRHESGGRGSKSARREGHGPAGTRYHPFSDQSDPTGYRRNPRLWWRLFWPCWAQRVGCRNTFGAILRRREDGAPLRRSKCLFEKNLEVRPAGLGWCQVAQDCECN